MDNKEEAKQRLRDIRELRTRAIKIHGYDFCDHPLYDEMLARENELLEIIMQMEQSKTRESVSRW